MTDAFGYAEACLKQGKPYSTAASASGVPESSLRSRFPGYGRKSGREGFGDLAQAMADVANLRTDDIRRVIAVGLRILADDQGFEETKLMARNIFNAMPYNGKSMPPSRAKEIIDQVAAKHGLTREKLLSRDHRRDWSWPRQEAYYEISKRTLLSSPQIARIFDGRDHSTILYGIRQHEKRLKALERE